MKIVRYTKNNSYKANYPPSYPNEMMVKIFSSKRYSNIRLKSPSKNKILEIGSLSGNNLRFFIENNYKTYGIEINQSLVNLGIKNLKRLKIKPPLIKIGLNTKIPFQSNFFDTLVSINTIHYNYGSEIHDAIMEFKRVLKKNGVLYLETAGKNHFRIGKKINNLEYKSKFKSFRKNHTFGFFDDKLHLKKFLKNYFNKVEICERIEKSKINLNWYVAICK
jgi:SAM-dependent methyltransferase